MLYPNHFYLLVDPINRKDSGVTRYTINAERILKNHGVNTGIISRNQNEKISEFRMRLANYFKYFDEKYDQLVLEAPETGSATREISDVNACIHIRLHCSAYLAEIVQGRKADKAIKRHEQSQISRASFISSPSRAATIASEHIFKFPKIICHYPNPALGGRQSIVASKNKSDRKIVLFVGRFHEMKGHKYIIECAKKFPKPLFRCVIPPDSKMDPADSCGNLEIINGDAWNKAFEYASADLVVIPSVFETASMVGIEALSYGTPVVSWGHLGICEYGREPYVFRAKSWDLESLTNKIGHMLEQSEPARVGSDQVDLIDSRFWAGFDALISGRNGNHMPDKLDERALNSIGQLMKRPKRKKGLLFGMGGFFRFGRLLPASSKQNPSAPFDNASNL